MSLLGIVPPIPSPLNSFTQAFPPAPSFTEKDYPDLTDKICIVTGSNTGVGKETARLLYLKNATVYIAARTELKARTAISSIRDAHPESKGKIEFLKLDLADLTTIKATAQQFLARESRLHLLINNAGVMNTPADWKTAQGYDMEMGTNCLGHFLFTKFLTPALAATAKSSPPNTVRVVWVSSLATDLLSPWGGINMKNVRDRKTGSMITRYGVSKAGNYFHSTEYARMHKKDGIVSVALNPGNLNTELIRTSGQLSAILVPLITYPPVNGAYTELFAALSPEVTLERSGDWIGPWGRFLPLRLDVVNGSKPKSEGGAGTAKEFWDWSEEQVKPYL